MRADMKQKIVVMVMPYYYGALGVILYTGKYGAVIKIGAYDYPVPVTIWDIKANRFKIIGRLPKKELIV